MNLYVIRHGETDVNLNNQINGINDIDLNETGINQANKMAKEIEKLPIDYIICSPLKRTVHTAKLINTKKIPINYDNRVIERDTGSMMYKKVEILDLNIWFDIDKEKVYDNVEGFKIVIDRIKKFINDMYNENKNSNILIVTHGDIYKAIDVISKGGEIDEFYPENCQIKKYNLNKNI